MSHNVKNILKNILPPFIVNAYKSIVQKDHFFGNFNNWEEAKKKSLGYEASVILERVKKALLKVKNGEAVFERDSVTFDKIEYSWPLLASLLWISTQNNNELRVVDFGGSLGSSYFQNISFLKHLTVISWNVVEQPHFVTCGKIFFEDNNLHFFDNIKSCVEKTESKTIIFSGVIQYLEKPFVVLQEVVDQNIEYVIFDRTPTITESNRIVVQRVKETIYPASFPSWLFNENDFSNFFLKKHYDLVAEFRANDGVWFSNGLRVEHKGFIFKRKQI